MITAVALATAPRPVVIAAADRARVGQRSVLFVDEVDVDRAPEH